MKTLAKLFLALLVIGPVLDLAAACCRGRQCTHVQRPSCGTNRQGCRNGQCSIPR